MKRLFYPRYTNSLIQNDRDKIYLCRINEKEGDRERFGVYSWPEVIHNNKQRTGWDAGRESS